MTTPLAPTDNVGYVVASDVYCYYTEYYGDGTIYGFQHLLMPTGEVVQGAGKTKEDLVSLGVQREADPPRSIPADLVPVPLNTSVPEPQPEPQPEPAKGPYTVKVVHADFTVEYKNIKSVCVTDSKGSLTFTVA